MSAITAESGSAAISKSLEKYYKEITNDGYNDATQSSIILKNGLDGIFGMPYQFMDTVDTRLESTEIGRKYAEKIVARMPLLFLTPCKQVFMPGFDNQSKASVLQMLLDSDSKLDSSITSTGKYYTTEFDYSTYYQYVNKLITALSYFSGKGDTKIIGNTKLKNVDWSKVKNDAFKSYFSADKSVVYYLDGLASMSESFSNSTTESSLASSINGYSDQANELKFLLGSGSLVSAAQELTSGVGDAVSSLMGSFSSLTGGMITDLASTGVSTIVTGGKIIFPKIWQDSGFSRSYSFDVKLRSPDHDSLSIIMNVLIPYIHILALTLPKNSSDGNPNGYTTPFLVKAYCKGMFNIDMGIITDLSVTRGAQCQWNDDGLPTQIDLSISIEDLYSSLFMTNSAFNKSVVTNTAMMDFLANLSGLNIAETEFARKTKMLAYMAGPSAGRAIPNVWNRFDNGVSNLMLRLYNKL